METFLNILDVAWPRILLGGAFIWSLLSSGFAWWLSGLLARRWWLRIILAGFLWLIIIILRLVIFCCLLFKGIMPWNQVHAWKIFTKLIECYINHKQDTLIAIVVSVLIQGHEDIDVKAGATKNEMIKKIMNMDLEDLAEGIKKNDGLLCDAAMTDFLKVLYSLTTHDQDCMTAICALLGKPKENASFIRKALGWVSSFIGKFNIKMAQENLIKVSKILADSVIRIACENDAKDVAYECVILKQMISDLGKIKIRSRSGNMICRKIDGIAPQLNKVGAMLCVMIEFKKVKQSLKLLEYKKAV